MTSTPTRHVDNIVIATKGLQDRNINIIAGTTVENKGKLILKVILHQFLIKTLRASLNTLSIHLKCNRSTLLFMIHYMCSKRLNILSFVNLVIQNQCNSDKENQILGKIFGPKRDENGQRRRLHNKQLHSLNRSPNVVRVTEYKILRWAGHVVRMEEGSNSLNILRGKPTGKDL